MVQLSHPYMITGKTTALTLWESQLMGLWGFPCVLFVVVGQSLSHGPLQPHELQPTRLPCPSPSPRACSNSGPLSRWCHPIISSSVVPFFCLQSFPASGSFPMSWLFASGGQVLELQLQHQFFQWIFRTDFLQCWLVGSPCSPRDSQESSPSPQFKRINSLAFSFLYGPTLTSIHDYWKKPKLWLDGPLAV